MLLFLVKVLVLFTAGIFTGGLILVMFAVIPSWFSMKPEQWVYNQQQIGPHIDRYMPALDVATFLAAIPLLFLYWPTPLPILTTTLAIICLVVVALISQGINVPINKKIRRWRTDALPSNSLQIRKHWITWHAIRTLVGSLAFLALLLSTQF